MALAVAKVSKVFLVCARDNSNDCFRLLLEAKKMEAFDAVQSTLEPYLSKILGVEVDIRSPANDEDVSMFPFAHQAKNDRD